MSPSRRDRSRSVDQDELPDGLTVELRTRAVSLLDRLQALQQQRGGRIPTLRGVGMALTRFPDRDHDRVLDELEHWALAGAGQRKPIIDWARTYATFLDHATPGAPPRPAAARQPLSATSVPQCMAVGCEQPAAVDLASAFCTSCEQVRAAA